MLAAADDLKGSGEFVRDEMPPTPARIWATIREAARS